MPLIFEASGGLATGATVVPAEGRATRWTVLGHCGCRNCQRRAFDGVEPLRLVIEREEDGFVATCVAQERVTLVAEEGLR